MAADDRKPDQDVRIELAAGEGKEEDARPWKLDKHGLPLVPQPSEYADDPLNWSSSRKLLVTLQISWLAFLGPMSSAVANPAFVLLGRNFHISTVEASYSLMLYILFAGLGPLLSVPLANTYGRRPVYLIGNLIAALMNVAAGYSPTWTGVMVTRAINGITAGSPPAIGAATICDLYFMHERGFYMGIFTFFLTNGPHFAPLIGGFIAQNLGWSYCYSIPGFMQLGTFVLTIFFLPETLYARNTPDHKERTFLDSLLFRSVLPPRSLRLADFASPLLMLRYLCIMIPGLYYMTAFGYGSVMFANTGSQFFREFYGFTTAQTGLMLSIPLLIGCLIGEASTGWFTDWLVFQDAKKHGGVRRPEARLNALWLGLCVPIGVIIDGICLTRFKTVPWIGSAVGMGIASFGLQAATTVTYTYCTDCYKPQSAQISALLNLFRSIFSAFISFYAAPLAGRIGTQYAFLVFAMLNLFFFVPFMSLKLIGQSVRKRLWQAPPGSEEGS